jgi:hypothetical protein
MVIFFRDLLGDAPIGEWELHRICGWGAEHGGGGDRDGHHVAEIVDERRGMNVIDGHAVARREWVSLPTTRGLAILYRGGVVERVINLMTCRVLCTSAIMNNK